MKMIRPSITTTTVVSSRENRMGIEVRAELVEGRTMLRAYHVGEVAAEREVIRACGGLALGKTPEILVAGPSSELRAALLLALEEGQRVLRDGRGLCEAA
jgi:hypothetical protein